MNRHLLRNVVLAALYALTGKAGLWLAAAAGGYAAPVWPPTGIAVAAVILYGARCLPGIWVGAFIVNFFIRNSLLPANIALSGLIATGNMLESLAILFLLRRVVAFQTAFDRMPDVLGFIAASLGGPVFSATIGITSLQLILGSAFVGSFASNWLTWWVGDVLGALVLAPLLITLPRWWDSARRSDAVDASRFGMGGRTLHQAFAEFLLFFILLLLCWLIPSPLRALFVTFVVYSAIIWAALVLPVQGLFTAVGVVGSVAIACAHAGLGPFGMVDDRVQRLFLLQFCLGCMAITMMILRGVSAEKIAATDLARGRELAVIRAKKLSVLGELISGIAHEINNPLTVIFGKAELSIASLEAGKIDPPALIDSFRKIETTAGRIEKIVHSVRFFSRADHKDPFRRTPLKEIVDDTLQLCAHSYRVSKVELSVGVFPEDWELECKPVQVAQVLLNLLDNARVAAAESEAKWVKLAVSYSGDGRQTIEISVTDSGAGVPPQLRAEIFRPFFTTKKAGEGTGLGLSVSERIVRHHRGTLAIDETSKDTRFVLRLPTLQG